MRTRLLPLCIAATLIVSSAHAQGWRGNGRLAGEVVDAKTGKVVTGAKVTLRSQKESGGPDTKTNDQGKWSVLGLAGGGWDIDVEAPGYATKKISVALREVQRMPPIRTELDPVEQQQQTTQETTAAPAEQVQVGGVAISADVAAAVEAGNNFLRGNRFKEAVAEYEKAYPTLSSNVTLKVALARAYYGSGERKKAVVLLDEAYKADPANVQNALLLASLLLEDGQLDRGKTILEALPASALTDSTVMVNIGILLLNKNQPAAARDYFTKAIGIDPSRAETYYYRGLAAIQSGKMSEARPDLEKVIELAADSNEAKEARELLESIK